jgi:hypothetical protein
MPYSEANYFAFPTSLAANLVVFNHPLVFNQLLPFMVFLPES